MTRRYREDGERMVRIRNFYVRRPQAYRVGPEPANRADIVEIVAGSLIFLTLFLGIPFIVWLVAA